MRLGHTIRVLVVDDHSIVRTGLRYFLAGTGDILVVGESSSGAEALLMVAELQPDVVLMDLVMPGMDGIAATQELRQHFPQVRVLVLSSFSNGDMVQRALQAGAVSYLMKDVQGRDLVSAIRATYDGRSVLTPKAAEALVTTFNHAPKPGTDLSARELMVLELLTLGLSNGQIAARLRISRNTVRHHVQNILGKLGVANRTEAVALALQNGLVSHTPQPVAEAGALTDSSSVTGKSDSQGVDEEEESWPTKLLSRERGNS
jgi:NarL family two-component system response regulator LiaR